MAVYEAEQAFNEKMESLEGETGNGSAAAIMARRMARYEALAAIAEMHRADYLKAFAEAYNKMLI